MKISKISFKNGMIMELKRLTVITGSNNSGKSTILKDINTILSGETEFYKPKHTVLIDKLDIESLPSFKKIRSKLKIENNQIITENNEYISINEYFLENTDHQEILDDTNKRREYLSYLGKYFFSHLITENRLTLLKECESNHGILKKMYQTKNIENEIREYLKNTFKLDLRLDYTKLSSLLLRIGENLDNLSGDLRDELENIKNIERLDEQGDGIKSFLATLITLMLDTDKNLFLLDEPEAFLHPPHIIKLGEIIAEISQKNPEKQIIISTHSPNLLKGLLNKEPNLDVLRINRFKNSVDITILKNSKLIEIITDPLLSSSRVLEGLFYKGCVITEADSDSIFYHKISRKLNDSDEIHYTHAHNKQTVSKVMESYKELKLKSVCITDFDIIRDIDDFKKIIKNIGFEVEEQKKLIKIRDKIVEFIEKDENSKVLLEESIEMLETKLNEIKKEFKNLDNNDQHVNKKLLSELNKISKKIKEETSVWKKYKNLGKEALNKEVEQEYNELDKMCKEKGLFIVPVGELESWLVDFGLLRTSNKKKWIEEALIYINSLEADDNKKIFKFISEIHQYLNEK